MVKEKFGKAFGIKETSVYKSLIKERKINQEKKKAGLGGIRMKDIVHEAINHFKNPVSFHCHIYSTHECKVCYAVKLVFPGTVFLNKIFYMNIVCMPFLYLCLFYNAFYFVYLNH